jgi:phage terminase Nu1 subunit (DNA packaging protein)
MSKVQRERDPLLNSSRKSSGGSAAPSEIMPDRHVSLSQLSTLLGRDRNTIARWPDKGCPFIQRADKDSNIPWIFDVAAVVKWLEDQATDKALAKYESAEGNATEADGKRRKAVAAGIREEIALLKDLKAVVPVDYVLTSISKDYAEIKSIIMKIPDIIAANVDSAIAAHVRRVADKQIRDVMNTLQVKIAASDEE